jgi:hypothetical protein
VAADANVCSQCGYNFNAGPYSRPPQAGQPFQPGVPQPGQYGTYNQANYVRPGYEQQNTGTADALAITSLILGILSLPAFCLWCAAIPLGGLAIILGAFGLKGKYRSLAIGGMICGGLGILLAVGIVALVASGALGDEFRRMR